MSRQASPLVAFKTFWGHLNLVDIIPMVGIGLWSEQPWQARQARFGPCLDFGFQYTLIRNNRSKNFGIEYWTLPGSNSAVRWQA